MAAHILTLATVKGQEEHWHEVERTLDFNQESLVS